MIVRTSKINSSLKELLEDFISVSDKFDCCISGLALDSRIVKVGNLFFAYSGHSDDGRKYIDSAIANGAAAIICEANVKKIGFYKPNNTNPKPAIIINLPNVSQIIGKIAAKFYNYPANDMTVIGVTGTNGKTSITQLTAKALAEQNILCGVMGTLGIGFPNNLVPTLTTSPDVITAQNKLAEFLSIGAKAVAIESSSHRLSQNQLDDIGFKIAIFTNLTRDHLDYHHDMKSYGEAKRRLFLFPTLNYAVINADDEFGQVLLQDLPKQLNIIAYSINNIKTSVPTLRANGIKMNVDGFNAEINTPWGKGILKSKLLGNFNVSNLLAVLATLCCMEIKFEDALEALAQLDPIRGRMQIMGGGKNPTVVVDYAHTPDALEKALVALKQNCRGELWCIFGCAGERDPGKRPMMGKIAEQYSDRVIITADNPRSDNQTLIVEDILKGLQFPLAVTIEHDRAAAINYAVCSAKQDDIILIAGKGHEDYQIIGKEKIHFDDTLKVSAALAKRNS